MNDRFQHSLFYLFAIVISFILVSPSFAVEYQQAAGLMDLRTTFSDGDYSIEELVLMAKQKGFSVVFINDHDRMAMEYGIFPFRNILRKGKELNSINKQGAGKFIRAIRDAEKKYPDMIIIPGSETTPFYYWTGNVLTGTLTANDHEKRLLTVGMENPEDYENLPILDNGFSLQYFQYFFPEIIFFAISLIAGIILIRWRGIVRITGIVLAILSIAFILNSHAFKSSPFDPYHGDQGMSPYQLLIDYVHSKGGMTFWNYPETQSGVREMGPIRVSTLPYPTAIQESKAYTGFSAVYGETITLTEPGNIWDTALKEYCMGYRNQPPWGIATADFHREGGDNEKLGNYQTVFFIEKKSKDAVLRAMQNGKMYACQVAYPNSFKLEDFSVSSSDENIKGISGDSLTLKGFPKIHIALSGNIGSPSPVKVRLIRSGQVIQIFENKLPLQIEYIDSYYKPGEKIFYRIDVKGTGTIVSNPIFVTFQ